MFVPTPPPPSPHARELADEIAKFVTAYREMNPDMNDEEVRRALTVANSTLVPASGQTLAIVVLLGMLLAGVGVFGMMTFATRSPGGQPPWIVLAGLVGLVVVAVAVFAIRRSPTR